MGGSANFGVAARRHLDDGEYLVSDSRTANADQLAGLAAECALKAILLDFLGATPNNRGVPVSARLAGPPLTHQSHIGKLWSEVILVATGRAGAAFVSTLNSGRPFDHWDIADRYSDGAAAVEATTRQRLTTARSLLGHHQRAHLTGVLS